MAIRPFLSGHVSGARWRALLFNLLALGLLALATAGFFWRILFAGAWMPRGGGDLASLLYPTYHFAAQSLKSGVFPLWNPYVWGGTPFASDIQSSLFYPVNLIYFALAPEISYRGVMLLAVFHFWLAGAGMFLCLRSLLPRNGILAPLFGGLAFMFSDYFVVHFGNLNLIAQAAWLPFIFLFYHRSLSERRSGLAVWAGVCFAVAATAGHIQPLLFITLGLGGDLLYHLGLIFAGWKTSGPEQGGARRLLRAWGFPLSTYAITLLVGLGLSAMALIPAYEMTGYTLRAEYNYAQASAYSLAPAQLVGLLVPSFFGRDPAAYWGVWDRVEVGYVGVSTLLLALLALLMWVGGDRSTSQPESQATPGHGFARRQPDRHSRELGSDLVQERRFFVGETVRFASLAVLSLLLAMGGYSVLHGWLYGLIPGLGGMRAPARFIFLMDFALAALAALGLAALMNGPEKWLRPALRRILRSAPWVVGVLSLFVVPLAFYLVISSQDKDPVIFARISAAANGLVFFCGLLVAGIGLFYFRYRGRLRPTTVGALAVALLFFDLASLGGDVDVGYEDPALNFDHPAAVHFLKSDPDLYRIDSRTDVWHLWQPNTSLLHSIFDVGGLINPLSLAEYDRYWSIIPSRSSALYDFLNAKYVIAGKDVVLDWEKFVPVFDGDPALNVYLNRKALPRALVVHRAIAAPDHEAALAALGDPDFDPAAVVVVEGGEALDTRPSSPASVRFDSFQPNEMRLWVDTPADAYLVLSEVWYPGWRATVDGASAPVLRANYAFRALRLVPGQHQVYLTFAPRSWAVGLAISGLAALALVGWGAWRLIRIFHSHSKAP